MALELAGSRIRVNALAPGYIDTEINHDFWSTPGGEKLTKRIPQRRVGAESDLDGAILLLASSASRYMTGSVITVDGGFLLAVRGLFPSPLVGEGGRDAKHRGRVRGCLREFSVCG